MRSVIKQKLVLASLALIVASFIGLSVNSAAYAAGRNPVPATTFAAAPTCTDVTPKNASDQLKTAGTNNNGLECIVSTYINPVVAFLAAMAGVAVVISIVVGAIQYSSAGGDPGKVAAARGRITKAIIALLAFVFLYAFINFILPGGVNG
ncbi:MAG: hypothetical protein ACQR33_03865 [Candidatus Saccharibacteria bacterium]